MRKVSKIPKKQRKQKQAKPVKGRFLRRALVAGGVIAGLAAGGVALHKGFLRERLPAYRAARVVAEAKKIGQFHVSLDEGIPAQTRESIAKMANIALNFVMKEKGQELSSKRVSIYIGGATAPGLFADSQKRTFGSIKTPNYYAVTVVDFVPGEVPSFNVHLNWNGIVDSFKSRRDANERAVLRGFGLIFNEVGGNCVIFDKYRAVIGRNVIVTPEIRKQMEVESFQNGIALLEKFNKGQPQGSRLHVILEGEIKFQKGLLESWQGLR